LPVAGEVGLLVSSARRTLQKFTSPSCRLIYHVIGFGEGFVEMELREGESVGEGKTWSVEAYGVVGIAA